MSPTDVHHRIPPRLENGIDTPAKMYFVNCTQVTWDNIKGFVEKQLDLISQPIDFILRAQSEQRRRKQKEITPI